MPSFEKSPPDLVTGLHQSSLTGPSCLSAAGRQANLPAARPQAGRCR